MPARCDFVLLCVFAIKICLFCIFPREVHTHQVQLTQEENTVYQKLLAFSRKALEDYIKSQENRLRDEFKYSRSVVEI